jgi:hypothetical protein
MGYLPGVPTNWDNILPPGIQKRNSFFQEGT